MPQSEGFTKQLPGLDVGQKGAVTFLVLLEHEDAARHQDADMRHQFIIQNRIFFASVFAHECSQAGEHRADIISINLIKKRQLHQLLVLNFS